MRNVLKLLDRDLSEEEVLLSSTPTIGLSTAQAQKNLSIYGKNQLAAKRRINPFVLFINQYKDIMTVILLVCTAVSLFMGEYVEAIAIAIIVFMNGILGFLQEYKTEKTLEALKSMAAPGANIFRDGVITTLPASEITIDDVCLLEAGDKIPADGILLDSTALACDESILTGESVPIKKDHLADNPEKKEMYMGCVVTKGHCRYKITSIGMNTKMGSIASMLSTIEESPTPLQKKLATLSKFIAIGCILVCIIVSITGMLRGEAFLQMLITGVSLAVAAVPEGLPAIVTISLALSISRMVKKNALVRRLHAVESLGCATVICSDKTGTITQNKMTATVCYSNFKRQAAGALSVLEPCSSLILKTICLCNNAVIGNNSKGDFGDHTELALMRLAHSCNITRENLSQYKRIYENPFDSERKRMSVVVSDEHDNRLLLCKGAFDILLYRCDYYQDGDQIHELTPQKREQLINQNNEMADHALRVISCAYKKLNSLSSSYEEQGLIFLGQIGMIDPPRQGVKGAVSQCHKAGIKTIMITGDHKNTAVAIARQVGIFHDGDLIITGTELDSMSFEKLSAIVNQVTVFARVSPNHKLTIVKALKRNGHVVAMTGDGVNDAPAIKEADIGVSMGQSGSDVTKEASEIILLDDNFATLVGAVDEGRSIYNNIRKFIRYLLSCNIGEVLTMFLGMLMGMPVILLPIQILLINLVTDGLPAIALGLEPSEKNAMSKPPRKPKESVFSHGLAGKIIFRGILIGLSTLASFVTVFSMTGDITTSRTAAFFALIFAQLIHVFECKSEEKSLLQISYFNNKKLLLAVLASLITLISVIYFKPLSLIFKTVPLSPPQLLIPILYSLLAPIGNIIFSKK